MRRIGSVVLLIALVAVYGATWFTDDPSPRPSAVPTDRPGWTGARVGLDENGVPTVRMTEEEPNPAVAMCRRVANDQVPVASILEAMYRARADRPGAEERYDRLAHEYNDALAACLASTT